MVFFSDFFQISEDTIEGYGAFNISLVNDLPLFIDPFLLFGSEKEEFRQLHDEILKYLSFLKSKSEQGVTDIGLIKAWYCFPEVKQNWFGYSMVGNGGSGLGMSFGQALSTNMQVIFHDLGDEKIPATSHLEKAGLFSVGVGRDNISDFTCNLIKTYLLQFTSKFAQKHLDQSQIKELMVDKAYFDYDMEHWMPKTYVLPYINNDFVLLTPKEILTKDENWINSNDLHGSFDTICSSIPNAQLRSEIYNYLKKRLPRATGNRPVSQKEVKLAQQDTLLNFRDIVEYYIKYKEANKEGAQRFSREKVGEVESILDENVKALFKALVENSEFYNLKPKSSYDESYQRAIYLKQVIETNDGYRFFYSKGQPIKREQDLQLIYKLTWFASTMDVNREPNNGRGPVDYAISHGAKDKTLVEFKLASNSQLKKNLANQVKVYESANKTERSIKIIIYFDKNELLTVTTILRELNLQDDTSIILIDARNDNKISASKV
jgi:hypothetical protein